VKAAWIGLAFIASTVGFAWIALAMEAHWSQVRGAAPRGRSGPGVLRALGAAAIVASLFACLRADHASMAALVWVMLLAAAALTIAFALSWRPRWLALLVGWAGRP
jgi:hypothetical protein